ncbi:MAG: flagellar basal-body rod protein FlgG [Gemmatimonadales bacterium]|nr:flagellar basal-body rod protein FlgG [Gemmatimonadales bacterium]
MDAGLRTSATGMKAQQMMVDVIANNLANVNTTGFKRSRASFEDLIYETLQGARGAAGQGQQEVALIQIGKGVRTNAITRLHNQGAVEQTGRGFDLAIEGDGFFQVQRPDGSVSFTRDGNFNRAENGTIVTQGGHPVWPGITIPADATEASISSAGVVSAVVPGSSTPVEIGRLELARFVNPAGLEAIGENQFRQTAASGQPLTGLPQEGGFGRVLQGMLESSNVEIVTEMTDMIAAQRAYEINAKAIQAASDMAQATNGLIR